MSKGPEAFRTISEVAEELDIPQHVLRFWETRFAQIKPVKRGGGRRFYRPDDVALLSGIRHLLYGAGYTIRGVQRILKEQGISHIQGLVHNASADPSASVVAVANALAHYENPSPYSSNNTQPTGDAAQADASFADSILLDTEVFSNELNVDRALTSSEVHTHTRQKLSSAQEDSDVDARAVAVSAVYTALTSTQVFPTREDAEAEGAHHNKLTENAAPETAKLMPEGYADSVLNRYAPGPLSSGSSSRTQRLPLEKSGAEYHEDHIIRPQYRLTTGTRENLQTVLDELRECRRLLGSALNRQTD